MVPLAKNQRLARQGQTGIWSGERPLAVSSFLGPPNLPTVSFLSPSWLALHTSVPGAYGIELGKESSGLHLKQVQGEGETRPTV